MYNIIDTVSDSLPQADNTKPRKTPSGHYLWIVLLLITGAAFGQAIMRQGLPVLYPFIQNEFGLSLAQVGLITSAMAVGFTVAVLLGGWLTDTLGVKRMITIALFGLTAVILAFPLASTFYFILILAALIGIVSSPINPATTRAVIDGFPVRIRALVMGFKQMGVPLAGTITAAALPALAIVMGWRTTATITGLLVLIIAIIFVLTYHDAPRGKQTVRKFDLADMKKMLRNRGLVTSIVWTATFAGFQRVVLTYFMLFLIKELDFSPIVAGGLLAVAQFSSIIARISWGAVSDFVFRGRRTVVLAITGFLTILWMLGASVIGVGVPNIAVYLFTIVVGVSTLSYHGVAQTLIGEHAEPGQVGVTTGVATTMINASQMVMPPIFGYLVDISGSYSLVWRIAASVAVVGTLALLAFGRDSKRR